MLFHLGFTGNGTPFAPWYWTSFPTPAALIKAGVHAPAHTQHDRNLIGYVKPSSAKTWKNYKILINNSSQHQYSKPCY